MGLKDLGDKMNLTGTYVIYQNGKEVARQSNLLTKFGKRFLTSYLAGSVNFNEKDIAVGIGGPLLDGGTSTTANDTQLDFEIYRSAVNLGTMDIQTDSLTGNSTYAVVYKTTIPNDIVGTISELGLFNTTTQGNTDYSSRYVSTFENNLYWLDDSGNQAVTVTTPSPLIGNLWFKLNPLASQSSKYTVNATFDLSGYSTNDSLTLAFNQQDLNLDYIFVRFYSSSTSYYEGRFPAKSTTGNKLSKLSLNGLYNSGYNSGTPDATSIIKISIGAVAKSSGSTVVLLDGLRVNDEDTFSTIYGMISRSVLSTPISKPYGISTDIEYRIGLTF